MVLLKKKNERWRRELTTYDVETFEENGHVARLYRAFDDAVLHTFPGCVFVLAMQPLGRDITHQTWK